VVETTTKDSGDNDDDFFNDCLVMFKQRYGREFDFVSCYNYLSNKAKYTSYLSKKEEEEEAKKPSRPKGTKAAKKVVEEAALIKQAISASKEDGSSLSGSSYSKSPSENDFFKEAASFLGLTGEAVKAYIEQQSKQHMMDLLDTPEKKELVREEARLRLAELRAKRRKLEGSFEVPTTVGEQSCFTPMGEQNCPTPMRDGND
jgi:predicted transcriptional regulator